MVITAPQSNGTDAEDAIATERRILYGATGGE